MEEMRKPGFIQKLISIGAAAFGTSPIAILLAQQGAASNPRPAKPLPERGELSSGIPA
jgi:hypothetical protein